MEPYPAYKKKNKGLATLRPLRSARYSGPARGAKASLPDLHHLYRLQRFGLSPQQYERLKDKQQGRCAICLDPLILEAKRCVVDHCHVTGRIRGLLCRSCNTGLGMFREKTTRLAAARLYLAKVGMEAERPENGYDVIRNWAKK